MRLYRGEISSVVRPFAARIFEQLATSKPRATQSFGIICTLYATDRLYKLGSSTNQYYPIYVLLSFPSLLPADTFSHSRSLSCLDPASIVANMI